MKRSLIKISTFMLFLCGVYACQTKNDTSCSLAGEWSFALDSTDVGEKENWAMKSFQEQVKLPGSLQEQGKGYDVSVNTQWTGNVADKSWYTEEEYAKYREPGNIKVPFWLTPDKHYVGVAWYQKEIEIPESWKNKRVQFEFERTHWETSLYVDGKKIGHLNTLHVPHRYVLSSLTPGKHLLSLRVDNRMHVDVGSNAHSVSDHTQTNWNGVIGKMNMQALSSFSIDNIQIYPDAKDSKAIVKVYLDGKPENTRLALNVFFEGKSVLKKDIEVTPDDGDCVETTLVWDNDVKLWSEFTPNVYRLQAVLDSKDGVSEKEVDFGFRDFKTAGTHFEINNRPTFLRGTLECCIFPMTGYPAMDNNYWAKIYSTCKKYGLNHVRFHSWCPPAAAFHAADSLGMYLQVECGGWALIGDGYMQDQWFKKEGDRILKEYGNHPSFCMMGYGNEPAGDKQASYLRGLIDHWQQKDNRRLYTGAAGWPYVDNADYFNTPIPRIGGAMNSILNSSVPRTDYDHQRLIGKEMPIVSHEIGQYCVYPDFKEIDKYTGFLKAKNFEIFRETLREAGMEDMGDKFLYASGRLQTLCYKAEIEMALRTEKLGGFQLLDLHDFPGQGTALVGVLNPFWESKGYVDEKEYSMFCNQIVPLARIPKQILTNNDTLKADIEFAQYGEKTLTDVNVVWSLENQKGDVVKSGSFKCDLPIGGGMKAGSIECPLSSFSAPAQLTLKAGIENTEITNYWHVWVYPAEKKVIEKMPYITYDLNGAAIDRLNRGENVLFLSYGKVTPEKGGNIGVAFTPVFWNTAWNGHTPPHTLGLLCDPNHPAFASFPNDGCSDFQWKDLAVKCNAMIMDEFPHEFRPLVYIIDDWFENRKLGMLFEGKVGKGNLIVCSADLDTDLENRLSVVQFKQSILEYMASDKFNPQNEVDLKILKNIFK